MSENKKPYKSMFGDHPYYNPEYEKDQHWGIPPYFPKPSKNPVVRFLDTLCARFPYDKNKTTVVFVLEFILFGICVFDFIFFQHEIGGHFILTWFLMTIGPLMFIRPDLIYRHYRNKYLKKHKLPGPYGYGSIDTDHEWAYRD